MDRHDALPRAFALGTLSYYLDFALAPAATTAFVALAITGGIAPLGFGISLAIGIVGWTLAEYLIHRFAFHSLPLLRKMHDVHHAHPKDLIGVASWGVFTGVGLIWFFARLALDVASAHAITAGALLGYVFYIVVHDRFHHGDRSRFGRYVKFMERFHAGHHRGGETNFGVSSPIWDAVFRTYRSV